MKKEGYNRNLMGGKRPHKKCNRKFNGKSLQDMALSERVIAESTLFTRYQERVGQK